MRLERDDQQITRHVMGILSEQASILYSELMKVGIDGQLRDALVIAWWQNMLQASNLVDPAELLKALQDSIEEEGL